MRRYQDANTMTLLLLVGSVIERMQWHQAESTVVFDTTASEDILRYACNELSDRINEGRGFFRYGSC